MHYCNLAWESGRKRRSTDNPTQEWFNKAHLLFDERGQHGSYFDARFGDLFERNRRSAENLEDGNTY